MSSILPQCSLIRRLLIEHYATNLVLRRGFWYHLRSRGPLETSGRTRFPYLEPYRLTNKKECLISDECGNGAHLNPLTAIARYVWSQLLTLNSSPQSFSIDPAWGRYLLLLNDLFSSGIKHGILPFR